MADKLRVGVCLCGSFCTFSVVLPQIQKLCEVFDVTPIMSETSYHTDTRFGKAKEFVEQLETMSGKSVLHTISQTEPIGPKKLLDVMVVAPCTGNTLAKLAAGIADSSVTLAVKAHLRNERPVVIAISTNDALAGAAKNIGALLNQKNMYFVPFGQDHPTGKPRSVVADMSQILPTVEAAAQGRQIQPLLIERK